MLCSFDDVNEAFDTKSLVIIHQLCANQDECHCTPLIPFRNQF